MAAASSAVVPRNFKLLDEYDAAIGKAQKTLVAKKHAGFITYGLDDGSDEKNKALQEKKEEDTTLTYWTGMIVGIQGKQTGEFLYSFQIFIPKDYPSSPPRMRFRTPKLKMDCVDNAGNVDISKIQPRFAWDSKKSIGDLLSAVRENMESDKVNKESASLGGQSYF